ncbi:unnamed protein product [Vicia faba]|uniref:Uncharacterized protein n=1 Tax=Vicia faba TaxID=3906 RepID=A0AAV1B0X3_VICFA|nr:unnamed protein product [Vicia faba]
MLKEEDMWDNSEERIKKYKALENQRKNLMKTKEVMWRQRSRALWLQDGDKNTTKKIHGKEDQRRRTNKISKLRDDEGRWWIEAVNTRTIHGIQIARKAPCISHLFFDDDCILFSRASVSEAYMILEILAKY